MSDKILFGHRSGKVHTARPVGNTKYWQDFMVPTVNAEAGMVALMSLWRGFKKPNDNSLEALNVDIRDDYLDEPTGTDVVQIRVSSFNRKFIKYLIDNTIKSTLDV